MFESIAEATRFLSTEVDENTQMRANVKVQLAVDKIVKVAMETGLSPENLKTVLAIVLNSKIKLNQSLRSKLIKSLIPNSVVPERAAVDVLFHISRKVFVNPGPTQVEVLLLRWVLLVFDFLESHADLHKLYNVVFLFINSAKLMPFACHLLFLLTRKADVCLYRVQEVLHLMEKVGSDPALVGLLTCYKNFQPHLVPIKLDCSHKLYFKTHDAVWRSTIVDTVAQNTEQNDDRTLKSSSVEKRAMLPTYIPKSKRQKLVAPEVHCASKEIEEIKDVSDLPEESGLVPYQHVESFFDFLKSFDRIEYPSQIGACLQDKRLQLHMSCNPDKVTTTRLCLWIQHFFVFGFRGNKVDDLERRQTLLKMLLKFSQTVKSLPLIRGFLENFLPQWNGRTHAPLILELVSCITPCSFQDLRTTILDYLSHLFLTSDVYFKSMYVSAMSKLIKNFTLHLYSLRSLQDLGTTDSNSDGKEDNNAKIQTCKDCLHQLIKFLDMQLVVGMRMERDHLLLQQNVLDLLGVVIAACAPECNVPLVSFPTRILQRLLLSEYSVTVARVCGIMNSFRHHFTSTQMSESDLLIANKSQFNALLIDMAGMIWQGTLMSDRKKYRYQSIFHFKVPTRLEGKVEGNSLTIYNSPAFLSLALSFLMETQREGKNLQPSMIKNFQDIYLEFLDREGFPQIKEFINLNLKSRKQKSVMELTQ